MLDADKIIRSFYQERGEVYQKVVQVFGGEVLDEEGNIDRKKLARIVFEHQDKLKLLEEITHGALYRRLAEEFAKDSESSVVVVEASLFIEKGTHRDYHATLLVYAPYELCRERALASGYDPQDFERRWRRQMPPEEKLKHATFVVSNTDSVERLREKVRHLARVLRNWVEFQNIAPRRS